ncbi:MAG: sigma-70 family RNA polymerase sigma factor [Bacilli bacterium]
MNYKEYNDYELLAFISENNEEANDIIYEKYRPIIVSIANRMFTYCHNKGLEINDLIQEGMMGLTYALNSFDETKNVTFYTYAKTCIERKIISNVISCKRLKHKILNDSISFETTNNEGDEINLESILGDNSYNPEQILINYEINNELIDKIKDILTNFEEEVFELKINDFTYKEIAEILDRRPKAIDNAMQRIKTKVKHYLENK